MAAPAPENVAAVWLARALTDALNPTAGATDAMFSRSLLHPLCVRVVELLASQGIELINLDEEDDPDDG